jgi:hypothetical protein
VHFILVYTNIVISRTNEIKYFCTASQYNYKIPVWARLLKFKSRPRWVFILVRHELRIGLLTFLIYYDPGRVFSEFKILVQTFNFSDKTFIWSEPAFEKYI